MSVKQVLPCDRTAKGILFYSVVTRNDLLHNLNLHLTEPHLTSDRAYSPPLETLWDHRDVL